MDMYPLHHIAQWLDRTTMYRVVLYVLTGITVAAFVLSCAHIIPPLPVELMLSLLTIGAAALLMHALLARLTGAPANIESSFITAFILFLILTPAQSLAGLLTNAAIAASAMALKYLVVYRKRHLFNPAALALLITGALGYAGVEWWVGSRYLLPVVCIAALLVVAKIRRWEIFLTYICASTAITVIASFGSEMPLAVLTHHFLSWPTVFFAGIMLTEPLGLPSTRRLQYAFACIVAALSSIPWHIGSVYATPELALILGNLFTFVVDRPERFMLTFRERIAVGAGAFEYRFAAPHTSLHMAGQYLEWTLPHTTPDTRGIRRYFTIVSAPGTPELAFAVRHIDKQSSFKQALAALVPGAVMYATQRAGDFTVRKGTPHHVWIAGGIGITPFMSMMRDAAARSEHIPATLFNCNKTEGDILFRDELARAGDVGVTVVNVLVEKPTFADYELGFLTVDIIKKHVPDWAAATYYISGPPPMVNAYTKLLKDMKIPRARIITDYFPGLA